MIETGRYATPKIPPGNRLCQVCDLKEVEDEFHFVMRCKLLEQPRQKLFSDLSDIFDTDNFSSDVLFQKMSAKDFDVVQCLKILLLKLMHVVFQHSAIYNFNGLVCGVSRF